MAANPMKYGDELTQFREFKLQTNSSRSSSSPVRDQRVLSFKKGELHTMTSNADDAEVSQDASILDVKVMAASVQGKVGPNVSQHAIMVRSEPSI